MNSELLIVNIKLKINIPKSTIAKSEEIFNGTKSYSRIWENSD